MFMPFESIIAEIILRLAKNWLILDFDVFIYLYIMNTMYYT